MLWKTEYKWALKDENGVPLDGRCDPVKRIIWLTKGMDKQEKTETYLHELGHAICFEYGLHLVIPEEVIELLVEHWAQFMSNNMSIRWK